MARSLGDLIDRLIVVNQKLWAVQDVIHKAAAAGEGVEADIVSKQVGLNSERCALMGELDECLLDASQGEVRVPPRVKIL